MIGPIGIDNTNFRHCRIPFFFITEIIAAKQQVFIAHSQGQAVSEFLKLFIGHRDKTVYNRYVRRFFPSRFQGFHFC